jgi:hypothetical protein
MRGRRLGRGCLRTIEPQQAKNGAPPEPRANAASEKRDAMLLSERVAQPPGRQA